MVDNRDNMSDPSEEELSDDYEVLESNPKLPATSVKPTDPVRPPAAARPGYAAGGPVVRSTRQLKPGGASGSRRSPTAQVTDGDGDSQLQVDDEELARNKGKITAKKAKLIWAVCIGVSVLAIAAFVCDVAFDLFGRRAGQGQPQNNSQANNRPAPQPKKPEKQKSAKEINVELFVRMVGDLRSNIRSSSRAYDFYMLAYQKFTKARENANKVRAKEGEGASLDKANAELLSAYWNAQYARIAYKYHFFKLLPDDVSDYPGVAMDDPDSLKELQDRFLKSPEVQRYQAAELAAEYSMTDVGRFRKDFLALASNTKIWESKEWEKNVWGAAKKKYDLANDEKKFDQADLDYMSGPDYGPEEDPAYMKAQGGGEAPKDGAKDASKSGAKDAPKDK